jgi:hypothetical protein
VLPSGQKLTLDLLTTIALKVVPFRVHAQFPARLPCLKCILEVGFCEGVQHRLRFCLSHLNCVKMASFKFYLQSGKQINVGWVGDDGHVVLGQKLPGENGRVRRCVVVCNSQFFCRKSSLRRFRSFSRCSRKTTQ